MMMMMMMMIMMKVLRYYQQQQSSLSCASTEIFIQALSFCIKPHLTDLLIHDYQDHADILLTWISSGYYPHFMEDIHNNDNEDI